MTTFDDADLVRRREGRLAELLGETDVAARPMAFPAARIAQSAARRRVMRWRVAAGLALLIAGAAGVPPVRAWIVSRVQAAWSALSGRDATPPAPAAPAAPAVTMGAVSFAAPEQLVIRVLTRQAAGELVIEGAQGAEVRAELTGERNAAELVVGPEGLRLMNRRAATAGYIVTVPERVARILVRVGDERARIFAPPSPGRRLVVNLASETAAPAR